MCFQRVKSAGRGPLRCKELLGQRQCERLSVNKEDAFAGNGPGHYHAQASRYSLWEERDL